jgi:hypothetical protein
MRVTFATSVSAVMQEQSTRTFPIAADSGRRQRHQTLKPRSIPRRRPLPKPGSNR